MFLSLLTPHHLFDVAELASRSVSLSRVFLVLLFFCVLGVFCVWFGVCLRFLSFRIVTALDTYGSSPAHLFEAFANSRHCINCPSATA